MIGVLTALAWANVYDKAPINMFLGAVIVLATLLPLNAWLATRTGRDIPLLAMHGLFYALCFGLGGFFTIPDRFLLRRLDEATYTLALCGALLSWVFVVAGYSLGKQVDANPARALLRLDSPSCDRMAVVTLYPVSLLAVLLTDRFQIEAFQQVASALQLFVFIWILHAALAGRLSRVLRSVVVILIVPSQLVLLSGFTEGFLAGLLVYGQIIGVTYALTRRRLPIVAAVMVVLAFVILTPIKNEYRRSVVTADGQRVGAFRGMMEMLNIAWDDIIGQKGEATAAEAFEQASVRLNHVYTVALVIADTPSVHPYSYGETLLPLLTKWVPRALWQDKPREDFGNRWSKEYGYIAASDDATSYNLPWLAEMYMNFGWAGIAILSLCVGAVMGSLWRSFIADAAGSVQFAFALTMARSFFFPESNMSGQIGSLIISAVAILVTLMFIPMMTVHGTGPHHRRGGVMVRSA